MGKFAKYKNKVYPVFIRNGKYRLKSIAREPGFKELVDLTGKVHQDIYVKEVDLEDLELIYERKYRIIYQGREYKPFAIGELVIENFKISLFSSDYLDYEKNGFIKKEQFVFMKEVSINEIDRLVLIKTPIDKFKELPEEKIIIPSNDILEYYEKFINN
ncbi:hypothetical protein FS935_16705 [Metabacillus litoralis]|uniref:Uncharacterized protein n=1 Tax=Metabacillus litoralis TaxID=152268 RepID=A0A5C6VY32_9BACI|nr:hypothetical protein [Metabacillus litoralis]TXC89521.1 hypothetical protein FS935_16705 [Metabacillus litoralis]